MLDSWYQLLSVLPFAWTEHIFMKNALLAVLFAMPLFGIIGTMVVSNRMAFFSDSIGHGAFTGIAVGAIVGFFKPVLATVVFSVLFAMAITYIKNKSHTSTDTVIGVFSSTAIALGLVLMSYGKSFNKFSAYLVGDLLSITPFEIGMLCVVFLAVIAIWLVYFNKLLIISINPSLAASRGMNTLGVEMIFAAVIAVVVAISIQWVGILIINSMLVLPAAAARNITTNVRDYHAVAVGLALFAGISGLILSYYYNTITGATIVLIAALLFFITFALKNKFAN
jgi:zinc transport system permease protein